MDLLAQMATFIRVVDNRSMSAAARGLRLSLPAVSRQLRALEAELGASLIERSTRRLRVTDAGQRWYAHCVRVLHDIEDAKSSMRSSRTARGSLVVSASVSYGLLLVVPRLAALREAHPQLVIDLRLEDQLVDLVGEGVDVALRAGSPPPDSTSFVATPLLTMTRVLVASPGCARALHPKSPRQLVGMPCLTQITPIGTSIRWQLQRGEESVTVDVKGVARCNAPIALRDLALAGAGIAYVPEVLVTSELASGALVRVLPEWTSAPIIANAVYRTEKRGDPRVRAFVEAMS